MSAYFISICMRGATKTAAVCQFVGCTLLLVAAFVRMNQATTTSREHQGRTAWCIKNGLSRKKGQSDWPLEWSKQQSIQLNEIRLQYCTGAPMTQFLVA